MSKVIASNVPEIVGNLFFSSTNQLNFSFIKVKRPINTSQMLVRKLKKKAFQTYLAQIEAHKLFDQLFQGSEPLMSRGEAYGYLQYLTGLTEEQAHISKFSIEQCQDLIDLLDFAD